MKLLLKLLIIIVLVMCIVGNAVANEDVNKLDFVDPDELQSWLVVNDSVMGGISQGQFLVENDNGIFFGVLSLENNGGFASVRRLLDAPVGSDVSKIAIRLKGDGGRYQFRVRTNRDFDGYAYQVSFNTIENQWLTLFFEERDFIATYRGMQLSNVPSLVFSRIEQVGFLISDKQQGHFALHIHAIKFLPD
ncbi:CIA30 family protein [Thalassotalea mangrovi]|uniref:CIA30 family protein n=1 Tax=Thalassotalea mangrovi TaxID=2572245 RepID=A0A4U1B5K6_9GAMM|nr:CIA30 family protein [Thalassotalea mangrovi]TKB45698.1 CIA30 family protein [Thalassotalea mangrovi]